MMEWFSLLTVLLHFQGSQEMSALPTTTDVAIIGAAPVGLTLSGVLAAEGVSFILIHRLAEVPIPRTPRSCMPRALEVVEELKVTDPLCAQGLIVPRFTVRGRDHVLAMICFDALPTRYPYTLMLPQNATEAILLGRLRELDYEVCRPYEVTDPSQDPDNVSGTVADNTQLQTIRARYVVAEDSTFKKDRVCSQ